MQGTPYILYAGQIGVMVNYLVWDEKMKHADSLALIGYDNLIKKCKSQRHCEVQLRRASFGNPALIQYSSLSREIKDALNVRFGSPQAEAKKSWFAQHYETSKEAYSYYVNYRDAEGDKLDLKLVEQYTYDASILETVLKVKSNRRAYANSLDYNTLNLWQSLSNDVNAFTDVPHKLPTTPDSLRHKVNKFIQHKFDSLISGKIKNNNAAKIIEREQFALLDELISKHTNLDNELIATLYNVVCEKMGWKTITGQTVANRKEKSNLVTYAGRQGVKNLKNNLLMQVKRMRPTAPMLYWTLDGWQVELLYQETTTNAKGNVVTTYNNRLTAIIVLDAFSKYPVGYAIGVQESGALITKALQNAMQHSRELFGALYMPYQLQSDNYGRGALTPVYNAITNHYTPAAVGNAKAKIIEPYFNHINNQYCKLMDNWSGYNVVSGSKNQPNVEVLNQIKKSFPDKAGVIKQIEGIIVAERFKKQKEYTANWGNTKEEHRQIMTTESYLLTFGSTTGETNRLRGEGLVATIEGAKYTFDSFDLNFRHAMHKDWELRYDTQDLSQVLAVAKDGTERFMLENVYVQPMALADRSEGDMEALKRVGSFNQNAEKYITNTRVENQEVLSEFFTSNPQLNDTLAKMLLTNSLGQHKDALSENRAIANSKKLELRENRIEQKETARTKANEQMEYYNEKVAISDYL